MSLSMRTNEFVWSAIGWLFYGDVLVELDFDSMAKIMVSLYYVSYAVDILIDLVVLLFHKKQQGFPTPRLHSSGRYLSTKTHLYLIGLISLSQTTCTLARTK